MIFAVVFLAACDSNRVFEDNKDFPKRYWVLSDTANFEIEVAAAGNYNLLCNVRNSLDYGWSRFFVNYELLDSTNQVLSRQLATTYLFDVKTGEPFGQSGIGDIYDHRFPLVMNKPLSPGKYHVRLWQMSREDTLKGVLAVGVRLETPAQ